MVVNISDRDTELLQTIADYYKERYLIRRTPEEVAEDLFINAICKKMDEIIAWRKTQDIVQ